MVANKHEFSRCVLCGKSEGLTYLIQCALGRVHQSRSWRGCSWSTWGRPPPHTPPSWRSPPGTSDRSPGQTWTHSVSTWCGKFRVYIAELWIRTGFNADPQHTNAKTVLPALTSAQWCYQNAFMIVNYQKEKNLCSKCATNIHRSHLN